jgi:hypothetical protein
MENRMIGSMKIKELYNKKITSKENKIIFLLFLDFF